MMKTALLSAAAAALFLQPGTALAKKPKPAPAAPVVLPYQSANLPTSGQVRAVYANWRHGPIWYQGGVAKPAAGELLRMLQRAPLDGIAAGPQYAAQLQAAMQQASTGNPAAIAFADHSLSEALVHYAQMMQRPVPGMIYGYEYMKPKPPTAEQVLQTAFGAPSLEMYLQQIANLNTVYTSIRDAAWRQMQSTGATVPDPRVVANLDRARGMPAKGRFVFINPANQMLYMYENGIPVDSMRVVVGDPVKLKLPTPMITSMMFYAVHNPYWNSPDNLTRKNIATRYLSEGESYLKSRGYEVMADWTTNAAAVPPSSIDWKAVRAGTVQIRVRQKPGPTNAMGNLKFPFANPEDIFLHDSPDRDLFKADRRTFSNGCIRLEDAKRFGRWVLGHEPVSRTGTPEEFEQLSQGVPIYVTYVTAQVQNGQLSFVPDVYSLDPSSETRLAANQ